MMEDDDQRDSDEIVKDGEAVAVPYFMRDSTWTRGTNLPMPSGILLAWSRETLGGPLIYRGRDA